MDNSTLSKNNTGVEVDYLVWYFLPTVVTVPPLGLPANALVIRLLLGKPGICSTSEIFILNLALFDMLFCLFFPVEFVHFVLDPTMAASNFVAWGLNQAGGPLLLCLLGLDGYMAVCHPLVFLRLKDPKLRPLACCVVCAVGAAACCLVKFSPKDKWYVITGVLCGATATMTTCNILMLRSLRRLGPGRKEVHPVKKRAFKTVLTASVLVSVHYLPPFVENLLRQFGPSQLKPFSFLTCVAGVALSTASFVQPLSYLVRTGQLPKVKCDRGGSGNSAAETKTAATVQSAPTIARP